MHIENYLDVINACRFCFMCRHLDPVGNVSSREADTPRGRALVCDRIRMDHSNLSNPDFIALMYRSALSAANRFHCVSNYDETGLVVAVRRDIVEAGLAPASVAALAEKLKTAKFNLTGRGNMLYFGTRPEQYPGCAVITGSDPGKALEVLGYVDASLEVFERFKQAAIASDAETLIVAEPSAYEFLRRNFSEIRVVHCSEYMLDKEISVSATQEVIYVESDFLKNYCGNPSWPRDLLRKAGYKLQSLGTNPEESWTAGEGALVLPELYPDLARQLCQRVYEWAERAEAEVLITCSLYVRDILKKHRPNLQIITLEEGVKFK